MLAQIEIEIVELHRFFQDWFTGALPQTTDAFSRMARVMEANFRMIAPNGRMSEREALLQGLFQAHGRQPQMRIWIEQVHIWQQIGPVTVATYEEWQEVDAQRTRRLSTALFQANADTPHGVEWLHVHETWVG